MLRSLYCKLKSLETLLGELHCVLIMSYLIEISISMVLLIHLVLARIHMQACTYGGPSPLSFFALKVKPPARVR